MSLSPGISESNGLDVKETDVNIRLYRDESDLPEIIAMIAADLSEPYSIYVYRYFIHQWPELCYVVRQQDISSRPWSNLEIGIHWGDPYRHHSLQARGSSRPESRVYSNARRSATISWARHSYETCRESHTSNDQRWSRRGVSRDRIHQSWGHETIRKSWLFEVRLLYRQVPKLTSFRSKRLHRYYLNGNDAFRYKLPLR